MKTDLIKEFVKSQKETTPTPTPWRNSPPLGEGTYQIQSEKLNAYGNWIIAEVPQRTEEDKANADFIVRAVNAHEELVKLLKEEHDGKINEQYGEKSFKHKDKPCDVCVAIARAEEL